MNSRLRQIESQLNPSNVWQTDSSWLKADKHLKLMRNKHAMLTCQIHRAQ